MTNQISVQMVFHFKGEEHNLKADIKLPLHIGDMTAFYYALPRRIAERNGVDTYSYMFDMMESCPIEVVAAEGYVARFLENGPISMDEFVQACNAVTPEMLMADIAERVQDGTNLSLESALLLAYQIGVSQGESD